MSKFKNTFPTWFIQLVKNTLFFFSKIFLSIFQVNKFLSSLYYFIFSKKFYREHNSVLSGISEYHNSLSFVKNTSPLLRRNIHRLEKALIMRPRRKIFANAYIFETVDIFKKAIDLECLDLEEQKWAKDVLNEYFLVVHSANNIDKARLLFDNIKFKSENSTVKYIPYLYETLPESNISYDELHKLFLKRRSVRFYNDKVVSLNVIQKAIRLATLAPSACNRQPYTFQILLSKEKIIEMASYAGGTAGWLENIPCLIAIIGDLSAYPFERDRHAIYIDSSLATMQLILAFETLDLSSCLINWPDVESSEKKMVSFLKLKPYERPIMLLSVGYASEKGGIPYSQKKTNDILIKVI